MPTLQTRIQILERQHGQRAGLPKFRDAAERRQYWGDVAAQLSYDRSRPWPDNKFKMSLEDNAHFLARRRLVLKRARAWVAEQT